MPGNTDDTEYLDSLLYFIMERGDPTIYSSYSEERFRLVAPTLHAAWINYKLAEETLRRLARDHKDNDLG